MSNPPITERLYALLPLVVRQRDADQGQPLRALLAVMEKQLQRVEDDVASLYDNWFIETCAPWVIPYIADLLGVRGVSSFPGGGASQAFNQRAFVANTVAFRRRKGTAAVIERLAQDVTGWPAHVVEFFQRLVTTVNVNHLRLDSLATVSLHDDKALHRIDGPFETAQHTLDVRHVSNSRGKYNVPNIGIFLWRLPTFPARDVPATPDLAAGPGLYRFNPLGADMRLFNQRQTRAELDQRTTEDQMPSALDRRLLWEDLQALREPGGVARFPGFLNSFAVRIDGQPVTDLMACDLSVFTGQNPTDVAVAIDPVLGRLALNPYLPASSRVTVDYFYGFGGEVGGGFYDARGATPAAFAPATPGGAPASQNDPQNADDPFARMFDFFSGTSFKPDPPVDPDDLHQVSGGGDALVQALASWNGHTPAVFEIQDSLVYSLGPVDLPGGDLEIRAAQGDRDQKRDGATRPVRPLIVPAVGHTIPVNLGLGSTDPDAPSTLRLTGLLMSAGLNVRFAGAASLGIRHTTLVPGVALTTGGAPRFPDEAGVQARFASGAPRGSAFALSLVRAITGRLQLPEEVRDSRLSLIDSVVDAVPEAFALESPPAPAPPAIVAGTASIERSTIFGATGVGELLLGSDSIFTDTVNAARVQEGCTRFSFVTDLGTGDLASHVPHQFRCQPALAQSGLDPDDAAGRTNARQRMTPSFRSTHYGDPYYAQLRDDNAPEILTGASDESEMGVFSFLRQPQRLANLRSSTSEYLRFGLEAGPFFVMEVPPPPPSPPPPLPPSPPPPPPPPPRSPPPPPPPRSPPPPPPPPPRSPPPPPPPPPRSPPPPPPQSPPPPPPPPPRSPPPPPPPPPRSPPPPPPPPPRSPPPPPPPPRSPPPPPPPPPRSPPPPPPPPPRSPPPPPPPPPGTPTTTTVILADALAPSDPLLLTQQGGTMNLGPTSSVREAAAPTPASRGILSNSGAGALSVDATSTVADSIWSIGPITLRDNVQVAGNVHGSSGVTLLSGATVAGTTTTNETIATRTVTITVNFPSSADNRPTVGNDLGVLPPGAYGNFGFNSGGAVTLTSGTYFFESLSFNSGSQLRINSGSGAPVLVYVRSSFAFSRGTQSAVAGNLNLLRIVMFGTGSAFLEAMFTGTVVVPAGTLNLQGTFTYRGQFFARTIVGQANVIYIRDPFPNWEPAS